MLNFMVNMYVTLKTKVDLSPYCNTSSIVKTFQVYCIIGLWKFEVFYHKVFIPGPSQILVFKICTVLQAHTEGVMGLVGYIFNHIYIYISSIKGCLLTLGCQTGGLFEGGGLIEGGRLFNFPSQSKKKPKPNTNCINRFSVNGVIVDRKYNVPSLNQANIS